MNIQDVQLDNPDFQTPQALWTDIFRQQDELRKKYDVIETNNGFKVAEGSIDNPFVQHRIKDFFWRSTEEIAEALEVLEEITFQGGDTMGDIYAWRTRWDMDARLQHFFEELIDALHFLVEVSLIVGIPTDRVASSWCNRIKFSNGETRSWIPLELRLISLRYITMLGLAANCLKNKPWKTTHVETDTQRFEQCFMKAWDSLFTICSLLELKDYELHNLYTRKNHVNQFRQRSSY